MPFYFHYLLVKSHSPLPPSVFPFFPFFFVEQRETIETKTHLIGISGPCSMQSWKLQTGFFREVLSWQKTMALEKLVVRIYQVGPGSSSLAILTVPRTSRGAETFLPIANVSHGNPNRVSRTFARHVVALSTTENWNSSSPPANFCVTSQKNFQLVLNTWSVFKKKKKKGDNAIRKSTKILSFVVSFFNSINVSVRIILSLKRRRFVALRVYSI